MSRYTTHKSWCHVSHDGPCLPEDQGSRQPIAGASLDAESDRRMILIWEQWAKHEGNEGAASLFKSVAARLAELAPAQSPPLLPVARDEITDAMRVEWMQSVLDDSALGAGHRRAYAAGRLMQLFVPYEGEGGLLSADRIDIRQRIDEAIAQSAQKLLAYFASRSVPPLGSDQ